MKYKITLPMNFDGPRYGLTFVKGESLTGSSLVAKKMQIRGFSVIEVPDDYEIISATGKAINSEISPFTVTTPIIPENPEQTSTLISPFDSMSLNQLKVYAKDNDISLAGIPNDKNSIIAVIQKSIDNWNDESENEHPGEESEE